MHWKVTRLFALKDAIEPDRDRLQPPANLSATERQMFSQIVESCPAEQFSPVDVFLLSSFARITLLVDRAFNDLNKAKPKERPSKMKILDQLIKGQANLSVKLRLSTSSRGDPRKLARMHVTHRPGARPWEEN